MHVQAQVVGLEQVQQAMREAPGLAFTYCKQELQRSGKRFKKQFIAERLSGSPGIKWPNAKRAGGGMKVSVSGSSLSTLRFSARLSRWLTKHETGGTITPKRGQFLIITQNTANGGDLQGRKVYTSARRSFVILRRVRSVQLQARLGFKVMFNQKVHSDFVPHLQTALDRAMKVAFERKVKSISNLITKVAA